MHRLDLTSLGTVIGGTWVGWEIGCMVMVAMVRPPSLITVVCATSKVTAVGANHLA